MYFKSLFGDSENLIRLGTSTLYNFGSIRQQGYTFEILNKTSFADGILHMFVCLSFKGQVNNFSDVMMNHSRFNTISVLFGIKMHYTLLKESFFLSV